MKFKKLISEYVIRFTPDGVRFSPFYLPVKRKLNEGGWECYIFFLAPIILIFQIIKNMFWSLWRDLLEFNEGLEIWKNKK